MRGVGDDVLHPFFCARSPGELGMFGGSYCGKFGQSESTDRISRFQRRYHGGALFLTVLRFRGPKDLLIEIGDRFPKGDFTVTVHI